MSEKETYTEIEAHELFAKRFNGEVWNLLEKKDRTQEEDERMIAAAYASNFHWSFVGTEVNQQRGEWILARVYTVLGEAPLAVKHASRCLELTNNFKEKMEDFDIAFAYEGIARAQALAGDGEEAKVYLEMAKKAGAEIADSEDKEIFVGDLEGGEWYGVR